MNTGNRWEIPDLNAAFLNSTLKKSPELSRTEGLTAVLKAIFEAIGVNVVVICPVDCDIVPAVLRTLEE